MTPAEFAQSRGLSERSVRKKMRELGVGRVLGKTMWFEPEDVQTFLALTTGENVELLAEIKKESEQPKQSVPAPRGFVYFFGAGNIVKIGFARNVKNRLHNVKTTCPFPVEIIATQRGSQKLERELHRRFADDRLHGEWFRLSDAIRAHIASLSTG